MQDSLEATKTEVVVPRRPLLGRRVTCQYYSPSWILSRNDEKRLHVVREILETEEKYIECLQTIQVVFEEKLRRFSSISTKDIETIFPSGLHVILASHCRLYQRLKQRIQDWSYRSTFGDLFVEVFTQNEQNELLRQYSEYSNNFPKAIATILRCRNSSQKFDELLQGCSNNTACNGLDLSAFLLNPIQRLPRYVLLITQLVKFTDASHPDRVHVEEALTTLTQTVNALNNSIQSSLKLANQCAARKRPTRRRQILRQKDFIQVYHCKSSVSGADELIRNPDDGEGLKSVRSRPTSICSSISSGYASDEGDSVLPGIPLPSACSRYRSVTSAGEQAQQRLDPDSGLRQLAQQRFDFANSCTSPRLRKLHVFKQTSSQIPEHAESKDSNACHGVARTELPRLRDANAVTKGSKLRDGGRNTARGRPMSMFVENFFTSNKVKNQANETNNNNNEGFPAANVRSSLLSKPPTIKRAYSDGISTGFTSETQTLEFAGSTIRGAGRAGHSNRMSWTPQSSYETVSIGRGGLISESPSSFRSSFRGRTIDEDSVSMIQGRTIDEDSVSMMSDVSTVSVPVTGKHAKKKMSLREVFRQLKPKHRENSQSSLVTRPSLPPLARTMPGPVPSMMMISAV